MGIESLGLNDFPVSSLSKKFEKMSALERLKWVVEHYLDEVLVTTSFGLQSAVLLHLISQVKEKIPVVWIDTGYLFLETYVYAEKLQERLNLDVRVYSPQMTISRCEALHGKLWEQGEKGREKYALLHRLEPMNRALKELNKKIWLSGLRREHSDERKIRSFVEIQGKTLKVYPILDWTEEEIASYLKENHLPIHPLQDKGYVSLGDFHSVQKLKKGEKRDQTRFDGEKYECGLHLESGESDFQI